MYTPETCLEITEKISEICCDNFTAKDTTATISRWIRYRQWLKKKRKKNRQQTPFEQTALLSAAQNRYSSVCHMCNMAAHSNSSVCSYSITNSIDWQVLLQNNAIIIIRLMRQSTAFPTKLTVSHFVRPTGHVISVSGMGLRSAGLLTACYRSACLRVWFASRTSFPLNLLVEWKMKIWRVRGAECGGGGGENYGNKMLLENVRLLA